ncbi:microtubule-associated protein 1-like, partial [Trifolium medium]|nr:microtubule-associated protein 1-like [Trifolium medium]
LQELASQLNCHWNLMDTPPEGRKLFDYVTCNISATADEVTLPEGSLAMDLIEKAEVEVKRLDQLYARRIAFKRQAELNLEALQENVKGVVDSGGIETTELFADPANLKAKQKEEKQRIEGKFHRCDDQLG